MTPPTDSELEAALDTLYPCPHHNGEKPGGCMNCASQVIAAAYRASQEQLRLAQDALKQAEQSGFEKHKLAVVTMFRLKAAGLEPQLAAVLSAWADMIGEIKYDDGKKT